MRVVSLFLLIAVLFSCNSKKDVADGFTAGTVVYSDAENDCEYTLQVTLEGTTTYYDPINLEAPFKEDGLKVRFQYRPLKMMNRCAKANPISLTSIRKQ